MSRLFCVLAGLAACAPKMPPQPAVTPASVALQDRVDWDAAGAEVVDHLSQYLRIDTSNPGGSETEGARFLGFLLEREGIPYEIHEFAPGRGSVVARLAAEDPREAPLCLLSHIDVVPADPADWPPDTGPLSGVIDQHGHLWGRGALDMKSLGIAELQVIAELRRLGAPLNRDVILLAVSDEEVSNRGMLDLVENRWGDLGCGHVLNEGALGARDVVFEGQTLHGISVGEKGVLWVRMTAEGAPGHGSTPMPDTSVARLRKAVDAIDTLDAEVEWHPMILEMLGRAGQAGGGLSGFVMRRPGLVRTVGRGALLDNPLIVASMTTTVNLTGFSGAGSVNVVPPRVHAQYDIRLQPGVTDEHVLAELRAATRRVPGISFEVLSYRPAAVSPYDDDPLYDAIVAHSTHGRPNAVAVPFLSIGFTDSIFAREIGVQAFGYAPWEIDAELIRTMHGHDERIPVSELIEGTRRLFGIVAQVVVDAEAP